MIKIHFSEPHFKLRKNAGVHEVWDEIRRLWLVLTPEEWVRQNFIQYLTEQVGYPKSLIAVEKGFEMGDVNKRFDILVYNKQFTPLLLVECKAMEVPLDEKVLQQAIQYNMAVPVAFICITNGYYTYLWQKQHNTLTVCTQFPEL